MPVNTGLADVSNDFLLAAVVIYAFAMLAFACDFAFGRKQAVEPKPLDVNAVIGDAERMLRRLIGEDIELTADLDSRLGLVLADEHQIHQVIMNLVLNARDAMPDGGTITIS